MLPCATTRTERGIDAVFEQFGARRRSTDFRCGQRLGQRDHLIVLHKPGSKPDWMTQADDERAPDSVTVRELRTGGKTLVTTLLCPKQTAKSALRSLYRERWHIELDLRNIKTTLGMERLSCLTPAMAIKEIWVYLLAYNLIRVMMAQAALLAHRLPRQLSFNLETSVGRGRVCGFGGAGQGAMRRNSELFRRVATQSCAAKTVQSAA